MFAKGVSPVSYLSLAFTAFPYVYLADCGKIKAIELEPKPTIVKCYSLVKLFVTPLGLI